jgi:hypothetical protein
MTPLDAKGEAASIKEELDDAGEKLQDPTLNDAQRNAAAATVRRLKRRIERLETGQTKSGDETITDPNIRRLTSDLRRLQNTVTKFVVEKDPDLAKVQPYMQEVLDENPEIAEIEDSERRIRLAKLLAKDKYQEDHPDETASQERDDEPSRAHRESGGAPVMTRQSRQSQAAFEQKMKAAKTTAERAAITDAYLQQHPPD